MPYVGLKCEFISTLFLTMNILVSLISTQTLSPADYHGIRDICEQFSEWTVSDLYNWVYLNRRVYCRLKLPLKHPSSKKNS